MGLAALLLFVRTLGLGLSLALVAGWSAAEAALFVVVSDVPISWIALRKGARAGLLAAVVAALASAVGAAALWLWAHHDPAGVRALFLQLPGVNAAMIDQAADGYRHGAAAILAGSFHGVPIKLFLLEAARQGQWWLVPLAPVLRLPRFAAVALVTAGVSRALSLGLSERWRLALLAWLWLAFYCFYWTRVGR